MLLDWLKRSLLKTLPQGEAQRASTKPVVAPPKVVGVAIYPAADAGLPLRTAEEIIGSNAELIARIRLHAARDPKMFDIRYMGPITRLCDYVSSIPGSATSAFSGDCGLMRASLELAFFSFQASDGKIFTATKTVEERHKLEPRWRYLCFLAGLLYPIGVPLGRMSVAGTDGSQWERHRYGLNEWGKLREIPSVFISWPTEDSKLKVLLGPAPFTASILNNIVGAENLTWLDEGATELMGVLLNLVSGLDTNARSASEVVQSMWAKVLQRETARRPQTYGTQAMGNHITPYIVGAMRTLLAKGQWAVNKPPLLVDSQGVYLVWPMAGHHLVEQGRSESIPGWPHSEYVLAEVLKSAGVIDLARTNDMGLIELVDDEGEVLQGFKLKNPNMLIDEYNSLDYAKSQPRSLSHVVASDPLAGSQSSDKKRKLKPAAAEADARQTELSLEPNESATSVVPAAPVQELQNDKSSSLRPNAAEDADAVDDMPENVPPKPKPKPADTEPPQPPRLPEVADVKFADLVPEAIRKDIKSPLSSELLGKVIKAWHEKTEDSDVMLMTKNGAAISVEYLSGMVRSLPDFITDLAGAGLIFTEPSKPGLKVLQVAIPHGTKPLKQAVILSDYACRKLSLK